MNDQIQESLANSKRKWDRIQNPKVITIIGRRWFQKTYGNTYHSATIYLDGKLVEGVGNAYGYGDQYLWNAFALLEKNGLITPRETREHSGPEAPWRWAERNGVALTYEAVDVKRKKDL